MNQYYGVQKDRHDNKSEYSRLEVSFEPWKMQKVHEFSYRAHSNLPAPRCILTDQYQAFIAAWSSI